jgi:hypothetical protein
MKHLPEKWYVGYDQEYDIDAGDDGRTIGYPTGRGEFDGTVFMVTGEDQIEIIAEHIRDEKTAHQIKAIPDMLEALETIMDIGDRACRDIARAAIRKARGEDA